MTKRTYLKLTEWQICALAYVLEHDRVLSTAGKSELLALIHSAAEIKVRPVNGLAGN
jgi:hypothetical protein